MRTPYRSDEDALAARADALERELEAARSEASSVKDELAEVVAARDHELAKSFAVKRARQNGIGIGVVVAITVTAMTVTLLPWGSSAPAPEPPTAASWFARIRPHCNPVEVADALRAAPPPNDRVDSRGYQAACLALAGKLTEARSVIDQLPAEERAVAAGFVFDAAHPVADRGDDVDAGPIMELVLDYWPQNYQAMYHAGMAEYGTHHFDRARPLLEKFVAVYPIDNGFRRRALDALQKIGAPK